MTPDEAAELLSLRQIRDRAAGLARLYQVRDHVAWDDMTPEEGYRAGQAFAVRYVLGTLDERHEEPEALDATIRRLQHLVDQAAELKTVGGIRPGYQERGQWERGTLPPPPSASDGPAVVTN